ncbi:hypothetical protein [Methanimicrococcus hacksteinii]|nr:hypothetical protein [Methanimicrococcus sp. At1]
MHHLIFITSVRYANVGTDYLTVSVLHCYLTVSVLHCYLTVSVLHCYLTVSVLHCYLTVSVLRCYLTVFCKYSCSLAGLLLLSPASAAGSSTAARLRASRRNFKNEPKNIPRFSNNYSKK